MTDDDIDIREAMRNAPDPTPPAGTDYRRLRARNAARHRAAIESGRCYLNGRPIVVHDGNVAAAWARRAALRR